MHPGKFFELSEPDSTFKFPISPRLKLRSCSGSTTTHAPTSLIPERHAKPQIPCFAAAIPSAISNLAVFSCSIPDISKHRKVVNRRMRPRLRSRTKMNLIDHSSMPNTWLLRESTDPSHFCNRQCRKFKRKIQCQMKTSKARESSRRPCTRNQASRCRFRISQSTLRSGRAT